MPDEALHLSRAVTEVIAKSEDRIRQERKIVSSKSPINFSRDDPHQLSLTLDIIQEQQQHHA
jgi:hypothetical protein